MNVMKRVVQLFCLMLLPIYIIAQDEVLKNDTAYFNQQMGIYQEWLDSSGIGEVLAVREYSLDENFLTLYLEFLMSSNSFHEDCLDTIATQWYKMKWHFDSIHPISLEQQLFYKQVYITNLNPTQVSIAIFDNYNINEPSYFLRGMYFQEGEVKIEVKMPRCKINFLDSLYSPAFQDKIKAIATISFQKAYDKEGVYGKVISYLKGYAEENSCDDSSAIVRILENKDNLWIEVSGLCDKQWSTSLHSKVSTTKLYYLFTYAEDGELGLVVDGGIVNTQKYAEKHYTYESFGEKHKRSLENYAQYFMNGLKEAFESGKY